MAPVGEQRVLDEIRTEAKAVVPGLDASGLSAETHIADAGIDSVQMLELVARLEERFDVTLPDYELSGIQTIGDLIRLVVRVHAEAG
ncbi:MULTISPECIES: acyl carrier protein [Amycolatopsis]|uniref:Acyl carrier protein n=2 Tax=Amycolatopsis TaxID=1813 RepID=A0A1I3XBX3_9PSEU|nr:acyl carrier protein [Amycolatopsis sacchari]SFK17052.1 acyl carrier protein [Amycolatopsis sacchari]